MKPLFDRQSRLISFFGQVGTQQCPRTLRTPTGRDALLDLAAAAPSLFKAYALIAEDELQGLRLLRLESGSLGLHAERLSIAPWNRPPERRYRRVGRVLVAAAILRSIELGYEGRFYCESLPEAEDFHRSNGLLQLPEDSPEGLARFSMTAEGGRRFLDDLVAEGLIHVA